MGMVRRIRGGEMIRRTGKTTYESSIDTPMSEIHAVISRDARIDRIKDGNRRRCRGNPMRRFQKTRKFGKMIPEPPVLNVPEAVFVDEVL